MSEPSIENLVRMAQRGRVRPTLKPLRSHKDFIFVLIGDSKPSCVVCGDDVSKGRHYTCSIRCQRREKLRVNALLKRRKEVQRPKMSLYNRVGDALKEMFG